MRQVQLEMLRDEKDKKSNPPYYLGGVRFSGRLASYFAVGAAIASVQSFAK